VKRLLLSTLTLSLAAAFAVPAMAADAAPAVAAAVPATAAAPAGVISGIDTQYIDNSVRPQDDFFTHLNGKWLKETEIPGDRSSWGTFMKLREDTTPQLLAIIETAQKDTGAKTGTEAKKIGDLYASFMDDARREALGYKPLTGELSRIRTLKDKKGIPALAAHLAKIGVASPYGIYVGQDMRESTRHATYISQSGLGMPDRDYYLKADDAKLAEIRAKYQVHVEKMLTLAGEKNAAAQAKAIVDFETDLAKVQWTKVENRDPVKRYNKMTVAELTKLAPGYDWKGALAAAGVGNKIDTIIVNQPSYFTGFDALLAKTDLATLKSYFEWQLLREYAPYLSKAFVDENFAFYGTALTGVAEQRPSWKRGVATVEDTLGEALGKLYVAEHFPAERKARMEQLVKNLIIAYGESIDNLDWMSPATKKEARAKLAKFTPKIGYPDKWRDYSRLTIKRDDLVGHDAADGQRLLPQHDERDRVPGRDPAAAVLRHARRRRGQLRGDRRRDWPRNRSRLRRQGQPVRWRRQFARLVDGRRPHRLQGPHRQAGQAVQRLRATARLQRERRTDAGRKHRRQRRPVDRLQGL